MKKWLDDLYAILMKRGFHTLDNVLKRESEYEEIKLSNEVIAINPNEQKAFNVTNHFNKYDRFMFYNRGKTSFYNFIYWIYMSDDNDMKQFSQMNAYTNSVSVYVSPTQCVVSNNSNEVIELDLYVKKLC